MESILESEAHHNPDIYKPKSKVGSPRSIFTPCTLQQSNVDTNMTAQDSIRCLKRKYWAFQYQEDSGTNNFAVYEL